jgi:hypothetical protein
VPARSTPNVKATSSPSVRKGKASVQFRGISRRHTPQNYAHGIWASMLADSRGRSDPTVFEKYPEIVSSVEADKQRRIDAMTLQSRLGRLEDFIILETT